MRRLQFCHNGLAVLRLCTDLVSQTSAALITASLENLSAVCGSHSLTETVFLASLSLLRLICSEHMHTSFSMVR